MVTKGAETPNAKIFNIREVQYLTTDFPSGRWCLCVNGALIVPYGSQFTVLQTLYFFQENHCISNQPSWTNMRYPEKITASDGVSIKKKIDDNFQNFVSILFSG